MPPQPSTPSAFVTLAHLLRPQGRRGELLADLLTDLPGQLSNPAGVFVVGASAESPLPEAARTLIESQWMPTGRNAGRIVLKLAGCDSITDAERLAHMKLMVPATERPALDPDTFYVNDLIGSTLYNSESPDSESPVTEIAVGEVVDIEFATTPDGKSRLADAAPLLAVRLAGAPGEAEPVLVPFVRAQLVSVDTSARRIVMKIPVGLLEPTD